MAATFEAAWPILLEHEGGYTVDDGGPTNFGWTIPTLAKVGVIVTAEQLKVMPEITAMLLYKEHYWNGFGDIVSQQVATKMIDMAVNMEDPTIGGAKGQAVKLAQQAVNKVRIEEPIAEDGTWGPATCGAINAIKEQVMVQSLCAQQAKFYRFLAAGNAAKFDGYLVGWLKRAAWPNPFIA